jgi:N-methylhydantoinase A
MRKPGILLGVDTGGTFTDFVLLKDGALTVHKRLSTPHAPEEAILLGIAELNLDDLDTTELSVVHGSTVATNAALEGKGVRTAFITNRGLGDMLTIGRQARRELYNLQPKPVAPPVPQALCLETGGRIGADGVTIEPLTADDLATLRQQLQQLQPDAVAINLLFSFLDDAHEKAIEAIVPENIFISRSSAILPEYKEYERGITTWLNAWVGPLVQRYLQRLQRGLPAAQISVMQSSGGTIAAERAGALAVHMLLSGPAGGLAGARFVGRSAGREKLLTFDMGGTSTDVALIDGEPRLTNSGHIGPWPVSVPMVDMHTIGAGGGSIAFIDEGGLLQVGPHSAGADPGPACYGRGGQQPTVTDANLVLGRLRPDAFLGGRMRLDVAAARNAIATIATTLRLSIEETAQGIIRIANEHMAQALRLISIQRGIDPQGFTLMPFGGAGSLHVCALAETLGMSEALVPVHGGVLSALGMIVAHRSRELSRTIACNLDELNESTLERYFSELENEAQQALMQEGISTITLKRSVDLRYRGQAYTLNIPWQGNAITQDEFHHAHQQRYGHRLHQAVELVNLRIRAQGPAPEIELPQLTTSTPALPTQQVELFGISGKVNVWQRETLMAGQIIIGPVLITETVATTFIDEGWSCGVDGYGNLLLNRTT